jgi:excisionase family DNA binding protein
MNKDMDLMTVEETARLLKCSPATLRTDVSTKRWGIPFVKIGRCVRYNRPDVIAWVVAQNNKTK